MKNIWLITKSYSVAKTVSFYGGTSGQKLPEINDIPGVNKKPFTCSNPNSVEFNSDKTVLKIYSYGRQKLGCQAIMEQADCPY